MTCFARDKIRNPFVKVSLLIWILVLNGRLWKSAEMKMDIPLMTFYFQTDSSEKYPQGVVTLLADDDHYFGTIKAADCEFDGEGARFVKAVKKQQSVKCYGFFPRDGRRYAGKPI